MGKKYKSKKIERWKESARETKRERERGGEG